MASQSSPSTMAPAGSRPSAGPTIVCDGVPRYGSSVPAPVQGVPYLEAFGRPNSPVSSTPVSHISQRDPATVLDIDREELISDVMRLRLLGTIGAVAWVMFSLRDWMVVEYSVHGSAARFLAIRVVGLAVILLVWRRLKSSSSLTRSQLTWLDVGVFAMVETGVGLLCLEQGGIGSTYVTGVLVALIARSSVLAAHWRRGLLLLGTPLLFFPATLLGAAAFDPDIRAQFSEPVALSSFTQSLFVLAISLGVCVWGGHGNWSMRRQLFASRSIGKYSLKRRIGRGGMGEVWVAYHPGMHRDVALKILRPEQDLNPDVVRRFEQEVAATTLLKHPNTVRVFDYGLTEDGIWYYAMELLEGVTLRELVEQSGHLEVRRALRIAHHAARALAEAHLLGIVHRDIKPENIFITRAGNEPDFVKVLDFGIAKIRDSDHTATLTRTGTIFGTPAYMSPEAAQGGNVGPASDVYGVGAVLYFMLTGSPPFTGRCPTEVILAHVERSAPLVAATPGVIVDDEVERFVHRCLAKAPEDRFADASELSAGLAELRKYR